MKTLIKQYLCITRVIFSHVKGVAQFIIFLLFEVLIGEGGVLVFCRAVSK